MKYIFSQTVKISGYPTYILPIMYFLRVGNEGRLALGKDMHWDIRRAAHNNLFLLFQVVEKADKGN